MVKKETSLKETLYKNFPWIVGVLITFLNLWLSYNISPIKEDIANNSFRISALEKWEDKQDDYNLRLEGKIDTLIREVAALNEKVK